MADPIAELSARLTRAIATAFGDEFADEDPVVRRSTQPRFGDYQANAAMGLAKKLGRNPREVAETIVANAALEGICPGAEVAGPGFINLTLDNGWLGSLVVGLVGDDRLGVAPSTSPETVVVDYSQPNVAREMHVGHLRSTIIGDALVRVMEFLGHRIIRQNHLGDWGTNFGMLIEHLVDIGEEEAAAELVVGDLDRFYKEANAKFADDPDFAARARARVVALQSGDPTSLALWRVLLDESERYFSTVYSRLGVTLTEADIAGESFYNPMLADVAEELETRGLAVVHEGALCLFPPGFTGRDGQPLPLIVRKTDGGYPYDATDLAAIRYRTRDLHATRLVYVVDAGQGLRFSMLFAAGEMAGWLVPPARAEHVTFGVVLGTDGKRFRARRGQSVKLIDLLDEALERARAVVEEKSAGLGDHEREAVASAVGIGSIKYFDLANDRVKDYVFDWDRMLAMDGNTAPYLQYAHARIRSIFRRAERDGIDASAIAGSVLVSHDAERALALELVSFGGAVRATDEYLQPHRLCTYLFSLASAFTTFYEACPVLRAESEELRESRLVLCDLTARTLSTGLGLLGIDTPDRM